MAMSKNDPPPKTKQNKPINNIQFRAVLEGAALKEHFVMERAKIRMGDIRKIAQSRCLGDGRYRCLCTCVKDR